MAKIWGHLSQTTTVTDTDRDTQALSANMGSPVWSTDVSLRLQQMAPNVGLRMHRGVVSGTEEKSEGPCQMNITLQEQR